MLIYLPREVEFVPNSMNSEVRMIDRIFPTYATFRFVIVCVCKLSNIFITSKNPKGMITKLKKLKILEILKSIWVSVK